MLILLNKIERQINLSLLKIHANSLRILKKLSFIDNQLFYIKLIFIVFQLYSSLYQLLQFK